MSEAGVARRESCDWLIDVQATAKFEHETIVDDLTTHQFYPDAQSCGIGAQNCISLRMHRRPRVNQDNLLRLRFFG